MRKIVAIGPAAILAASLEGNIAQEVLTTVRRVSKWGQSADLAPEERAKVDQYLTVATTLQHLLNQKQTERKNPKPAALPPVGGQSDPGPGPV